MSEYLQGAALAVVLVLAWGVYVTAGALFAVAFIVIVLLAVIVVLLLRADDRNTP